METLSGIAITPDEYFDKKFAKLPTEGECQVGITAGGPGKFALHDVADGRDEALDVAARWLAQHTQGSLEFVSVAGGDFFMLTGWSQEDPEKLIAAAGRWSERPRRTWLAQKLDQLIDWLDPAEFGGLLGAGR